MSISVIIPTYNRAHIIEKAINSVLEQSISPLEIIVVDDHSTDNTEEVISAMNDNRIKYALNQNKKGANGARNTGIRLAQGEYIAFQDSDDIWMPDKIEKQLAYMQSHPDVDMCFSSLKLLDSAREVVPDRFVNPEEVQELLKNGNFISTQTIFIKSEVALSVLFDEQLMRFQDWDFCLRVTSKHSVHHLHEPLVVVEPQGDSIGKKVNTVEALDQLFVKHPDLAKSIPIKAFYNRELFHKNKKPIYFVKFLMQKLLTELFLRGKAL